MPVAFFLNIEFELYCIFFELHLFNVENAGYMLHIFIPSLAASTNIKSPGGPGRIKPAIKRPFAPLEGCDAQTEVKKTALFLKKQIFSCSDCLGGCRPNNSLYVHRHIFQKCTLLTT